MEQLAPVSADHRYLNTVGRQFFAETDEKAMVRVSLKIFTNKWVGNPGIGRLIERLGAWYDLCWPGRQIKMIKFPPTEDLGTSFLSTINFTYFIKI